MVVADQFGSLDEFVGAAVETRGAAVVLHLQRTSGKKHFAPNNLSGDILRGFGERGASEKFLGAFSEAIEWMRINLLCVPDLTQLTAGAWFILTKAGLEFTQDKIDLIHLRKTLPAYLLHSRIREVSLPIFMIGKYEAAVFEAFKLIEITIRKAAGYADDKHGVPMVVQAFHHDKGPLRLRSDIPAEREAMQNFMGGALGLFKNPRSHRNTDLEDPKEAAELLMIASNIMRVVESHAPGGTVLQK